MLFHAPVIQDVDTIDGADLDISPASYDINNTVSMQGDASFDAPPGGELRKKAITNYITPLRYYEH